MKDKESKWQVELVGVTKIYKDTIAVNNSNIKIKAGEFFSLLGPSGCGKTTTLRIIAGLEPPDEGKVFLEGRDVTNVPAHRRNVNTVFQDYAIFPHMSVYDNIYFPLKMRKISKKEADPRIKRALKLVNLEGFEKRYSSQVSGGQRQRVASARALVNEPKVLLLDEPLGALDFKLRVAMQKVLKDIQRNLNITFMYVTHDQTEAITMSDRIAVMCEGVIHQIGTPDEIYNNPATAFVASFIGEMNFLEGLVASIPSSDTVKVSVSNKNILCKNNDKKILLNDGVLVSIRPEKVHVNPLQPLKNIIEAELSRIVFKGNNFEVTAKFDKSEVRSLIDYKGWDKSQKVGNRVKIGWNPEDVLVFPISMKNDMIQYE
jgi:spermidine/putrescine transport system ATP-binding protein